MPSWCGSPRNRDDSETGPSPNSKNQEKNPRTCARCSLSMLDASLLSSHQATWILRTFLDSPFAFERRTLLAKSCGSQKCRLKPFQWQLSVGAARPRGIHKCQAAEKRAPTLNLILRLNFDVGKDLNSGGKMKKCKSVSNRNAPVNVLDDAHNLQLKKIEWKGSTVLHKAFYRGLKGLFSGKLFLFPKKLFKDVQKTCKLC